MRAILGFSALTIFCLCLAHSVHAQATHDPGKILVYGAGNVSCGTWVTSRKEHNEDGVKQITSWMLGFMSGLSSGLGPNKFKTTDVDGVSVFLDSECAKNPTEHIYNAGIALMHSLEGSD